MDLELPITLVVKAPNQKIDDQTIQCALDWTIKKLKEHLSNVYPSKPRENQQKLIYSGRLLNDHLMLKDVLRQYDENVKTYTMHLVCAPTLTESAQEAVSSSTSSASSSASTSREEIRASSASASNEGLRQRRPASVTPTPTPLATTAAGTTAADAMPATPAALQNIYGANMMYGSNFYPGMMPPGMMAYSPEQLMWLQQMYAQHMTQYMQLYQGAVPPTRPSTPAVNAVQQPAAANQNAPPINAAANQRDGAADQPIMMNAQGGMVVDDDEDMNRDWLDWMYTLSRVAVLLSIVYFYSTFGRFVLVLSLFVMAYLYQGGWFRIQRRVQRVNPEPAQPQEAPEVNQQQNDPPTEATTDDEDSSSTATMETTESVEPPPPGRISVAWSFIYTFFSSLVPQQPPAINAN